MSKSTDALVKKRASETLFAAERILRRAALEFQASQLSEERRDQLRAAAMHYADVAKFIDDNVEFET